MVIHIKKLSVGTESVAELCLWQETQRGLYHGQEVIMRTTRNKPKRDRELLEGGSIYWIIGGRMRCRQGILGLEKEVDEEGRSFCKFLLDPEIIPTQSPVHKPFQGWRYLNPEDAPKDSNVIRSDDDDEPPDDLAAALLDIGLL